MTKACTTLLFLLLATIASGQTGTPASKLTWDQTAPDLASAAAYTYLYYPDGATTSVTLTAVTCTGTVSPFVCQVAFPAFTPGSHTLTLSASNVAGESAHSAPFAFVFVVVPSVPTNIRIR